MALRALPISLTIPKPPVLPELFGNESVIDAIDNEAETPSRVIWAENVMPTELGLCSIVYNDYITDTDANTTLITTPFRVVLVFDIAGNSSYYYRSNNGNHMVFRSGAWVSLGTAGTGSYVVLVRGISFVYAVGNGVYYFSSGFAAMVSEPLSGLTASAMLGFTSSMNYAIGWDEDFIYWSAPGIQGQFIPVIDNVLTGAGSSQIVELVGKIIVCMRIAGGFIIYGNLNIISARYSGNARNPWIFKALEGAGGVIRIDSVYSSDAAEAHYAWTNKGLKVITLAKCEDVFPEFSKFLNSYVYWNSDGDGTFTKVSSLNGSVPMPLYVKISYIANKYVCISYGAYTDTVYKYCLVYDVDLNQYGHLKLEHTDVFEFQDFLGYANNIFPNKGIGNVAFMQTNGIVKVAKQVEEDPSSNTDSTTVGEVLFKEVKWTKRRVQGINKISAVGYKRESGMVIAAASRQRDNTYTSEVNFTADNLLYDWFGITEGFGASVRVKGRFNLTSLTLNAIIRGGVN